MKEYKTYNFGDAYVTYDVADQNNNVAASITADMKVVHDALIDAAKSIADMATKGYTQERAKAMMRNNAQTFNAVFGYMAPDGNAMADLPTMLSELHADAEARCAVCERWWGPANLDENKECSDCALAREENMPDNYDATERPDF